MEHAESIVAIIAFNVFMSWNLTNEIIHFIFSLTGSVLSGLIVFLIKRYAEKNWDKWFNQNKK